MILLLLSYVGGFLTILSPCILPVLPFVFAKADKDFLKSGLPLLGGMAFTFAVVSTLAVIGGSWVSQLGEAGRWIALVFLTLFALSLLFPIYLETFLAPLTRIGVKLNKNSDGNQGVGSSFILGIATGFLWAPCAGPILGLILTGAATQASPIGATVFLLAYALGAASSLALALFAGKNVFAKLKTSLRAEARIKQVLGVLVLFGVLAIVFNLDRTVLTKISAVKTDKIEQSLLKVFGGQDEMESLAGSHDVSILKHLEKGGDWLNSQPLKAEDLKGKVVLVDFWTYSCINCLRTLPYVKAWYEKYKDMGFTVVGVHTPEFAFEKNLENVQKAVTDLEITYPVTTDNDFAVWRLFKNRYWPAHYFIDRNGRLRHQHYGEGEYKESEEVIQRLVSERVSTEQATVLPEEFVNIKGEGALAPSGGRVRSPETYIGYQRAENFKIQSDFKKDKVGTYVVSPELKLNDWGLSGDWEIGLQRALNVKASGKITYRFFARDVHLVLGPGNADKIIRFKVTLDGQAPGAEGGVDIDENGMGEIKEHRLYQLIRQQNVKDLRDRIFEIEFLDPGAEAFAFTFG